MPAYRPSAVMRLVLRLDEGEQTADLIRQLQEPGANAYPLEDTSSATIQSFTEQASTLNKLSELAGNADPTLVAELEKALAQKRAAQAGALASGGVAQQPVAVAGFAPGDALTVQIASIPVERCEVERNSFRTMDGARVTLNYYDAPFDPRLLRAAAVELVMGVVPDVEYDAGVHGLKREDGSRHSQVQDAAGLRAETRFFGFVTQWQVDMAGATIEMVAQDLMSIMRDTRLEDGTRIDVTKPIDEGIKGLLNQYPALQGIPVAWQPSQSLSGAISGRAPVPAVTRSRRKKKVGKGKASRGRRMGENTTVWDHITDTCIATGVVPVIRDWGLRLEYARTLFGAQPNAPRMIWGRNLSGLSFMRKLAGFKNPTIETRSYSVKRGATLAARYPGDETGIVGRGAFKFVPRRANRVTPSGSNPDEQIRVVPIADIDDPKLLLEIARGIYEETARQEIEGTMTTEDPSSFGVEFQQANLLDLRAGESLQLEIDARQTGDVGDIVTQLQGMSPQERAQRLVAVGVAPRVAVQLAALLDSSSLQTVYRVRTTRLNFDHDEGFDITIDFQNYITIRDDPSSPDAVQSQPSDLAKDAAGNVRDAAADTLLDASEQRRRADAQGQAGVGPGATPNQQNTERTAGQINRER